MALMRFWASHMLEPDCPLLEMQVWPMMFAHACTCTLPLTMGQRLSHILPHLVWQHRLIEIISAQRNFSYGLAQAGKVLSAKLGCGYAAMCCYAAMLLCVLGGTSHPDEGC